MDPDAPIRNAAFTALAEIAQRHGSAVPASALTAGFMHGGERIHFRSQQGIFRPRQMRGAALSITTVVNGPYDDQVGADAGSFVYRYRANGPESFDNRILREAFRLQAPIIYFRGLVPGLYSPLWPCFVTHDDPAAGLVHVEVGIAAIDLHELHSGEVERRYVMREVKARLHQTRFRHLVIGAYGRRCTICRLREPRLLEASHILPDRDERGVASVPNGLALCAIHHEAFDRDLLGISPDHRVRLSRRLLDDEDGPMLEWGLKVFHDQRITLPRRAHDHPSPDHLEERFARFTRAA